MEVKKDNSLFYFIFNFLFYFIFNFLFYSRKNQRNHPV